MSGHPSFPTERRDASRIERAAKVMRALGHPVRLRMVEALADGGRTVSDLVAYMGQPQPIVSQQIRALKALGIVEGRREGSFVRYTLTERSACWTACGTGRAMFMTVAMPRRQTEAQPGQSKAVASTISSMRCSPNCE